jgi:dienelactone hydrolase
MIWDGIRAVDYLLSRNEVDPQRLGITGRSGGGTQSSYIGAFDERILAVAPECYITSLHRLIESIGPQDAEQNLFHGLAQGIDHADLLEVRAPKPAMLITTTRDFFSIQGARETAKEIKKAYNIFGKANNFHLVEDDDVHASTKANRERMYAFFQKYLELPGTSEDEEVNYLSREELRITKTSQVITDLGGETIFSLNLKDVNHRIKTDDYNRSGAVNKPEILINMVKNLIGYRHPQTNREVVFTGRYKRPGYAIEKYFIEGEGRYPVPFLVIKPTGKGPFPAIIYLHDEDKGKQLEPGGEIEWFVKKGYMVISPDLLGRGEVGPKRFRGDSYNFGPGGRASYNIWFLSVHTARTILGVQTSDLERLLRYIQSRADVKRDQISGIARGDIGPVLTHFAALNSSISKIALIDPLISYKSLVQNKYYNAKYMLTAVPGSISKYDLSDLYTIIAPRKLLLVNVVNQIDVSVDPSEYEIEFEHALSAYRRQGAEDNFQVFNKEFYHSNEDIFNNWINE